MSETRDIARRTKIPLTAARMHNVTSTSAPETVKPASATEIANVLIGVSR
jgi:hypothetical protein